MQKFVLAASVVALASANLTCTVTNVVTENAKCVAPAEGTLAVADATAAGPIEGIKFVTYTTTDAEATCATVQAAAEAAVAAATPEAPATADEVCVDNIKMAVPTEAQDKCFEKKGSDAACPLAVDDACDTATASFCGTGNTCVATEEGKTAGTCTKDAAPAEKYAAVLTGFTAEDKEELQAQLDEVFKAAEPAPEPAPEAKVQEDPVVNNCEGVTATVTKFYPERAFVEFSTKPTEACTTQVAEQFKVEAQDPADPCLTACGTANCKCPKGEACDIPAEGEATILCQDGLKCEPKEEGATTGVCNSSVVASAALAVAAALLAVIF